MKKTTTRTTGNFCFISISLNGDRKTFFSISQTHNCLVNPGGCQHQCYPDFLLPERHPSSDVYIALLEGVEPWEAADTKGGNRGIVCILPQEEKSVRQKPCRSQHLCGPPSPQEQFMFCQWEGGGATVSLCSLGVHFSPALSLCN